MYICKSKEPMKLSEHLTLAEVIRSDTAKRNGISNIPTDNHLDSLKILAEKIFEPIRTHFDVPIYVSSGYRSAELNKLIKGATSSQHLKGEALDLDQDGSPYGITNANVFNYIKDHLSFDQLIWEAGNNQNPDWVHVSFNTSSGGIQRKQVLRMTKFGGAIQYLPYK